MASATATAGEHFIATPLRRWLVVSALSFASIVSYVDRQIINLLVEPIKADLGLSDLEISLLQGFSFALLYALLAIPIAWIADRRNRKWVILAGMVGWSAATFSSGLASSFAMLFAARMMVGIGEATLAPAGFSILSDSFSRDKLPAAISVFTGSGFVGSGLALIIGGAIVGQLNAIGDVTLPFGVFRPWQMTFLAVSLMSLPAFILVLLIREPARRNGSRVLVSDNTQRAWEIFSYLFAHWTVFCLSSSACPASLRRSLGLGHGRPAISSEIMAGLSRKWATRSGQSSCLADLAELWRAAFWFNFSWNAAYRMRA